MIDEDIAGLLGRVSLGDRDAFAELYRQTSPKLFGICLRILGNRGEAEEALQEIYVKIWQRHREDVSQFLVAQALDVGAPYR